MKKYLTSIGLIALILFNTLLPNYVYADNNTATNSSTSSSGYIFENFADVENKGVQDVNGIIGTITLPTNGEKDKTTESRIAVNGSTEPIKETGGVITTVVKIIVGVLSLIPQGVHMLLSLVTSPYDPDGGEVKVKNPTGDGYQVIQDFHYYTIQNTVYGKISLFDINVFNTKGGDSTNPNTQIKEQVANWFYVVRDISIIFSLIMLIYTGVRMAISTIAADQAKYKKMLIDWLKSVLVLFVLPYILIFIQQLGLAFLNMIPQKGINEGFETKILETITLGLSEEGMMKSVGAFITLCLLVYYQAKFFLRYSFRFFKVAFLTIISPLITVLDSVDNGKSQAKLFSNYIGLVFMQVIHALIYSIFVFSAAAIAEKAPIIAVAFFMALSRGERIFAYVLNLKSDEK